MGVSAPSPRRESTDSLKYIYNHRAKVPEMAFERCSNVLDLTSVSCWDPFSSSLRSVHIMKLVQVFVL